MEQQAIFRLRIQNCIETMIDLHRTICEDFGDGESLSEYLDLEHGVKNLEMSWVSEADVQMVEQATNALLEEFKAFFVSEEPDLPFLFSNN